MGADAGFGAIIGLAILILLYFAQARETATLRDGAAEAAERIRQLESRINQLIRAAQAAQAQPQPAPVAAQQLRQAPPPARFAGGASVPAPAPAVAGVRAAPAGPGRSTAVLEPMRTAPAGVGAPALTAATKLIPTDVIAAVPEPLAPPAVGAPTVSAPPPLFDTGALEEIEEPPLTNGHTVQRPSLPRPTTAAGAIPPRVQIRAGQPPAGGARRAGTRPIDINDDEPPASPARRIIYAVIALAVIAVVVIVLINATGGSSPKIVTSTTPTTNAPAPKTKKHHKHAAVDPADVTVAVFNGTASEGLAGRVSDQLSALGYRKGKVGNIGTQTQTTTIVYYLAGFEKDAKSVASALHLSAATISPIDPSAQSAACPPPASCTANVVVTVGGDLATDTGTSTAGSTSSGIGTSTEPGFAPAGTTTVG